MPSDHVLLEASRSVEKVEAPLLLRYTVKYLAQHVLQSHCTNLQVPVVLYHTQLYSQENLSHQVPERVHVIHD